MKAIQIESPGPDYRLVVGQKPEPKPGPGQVLIAVAGAGLNNADLLQGRGKYPPPPGASPILGMEASGTIMAMGDDVSGWKAGDKVCALLAGGGYAEQAVADQGCVLPLPDGIDLVEAAGLPEALFTAWTNVMDMGRLQPDETLLIHGGTSGIGSLAIQMFAARGHRIFTTAGSEKKCEAARKLGAARAINYREEDFVAVVKKETGAAGVNVILDMVGGDYVQRNIEACAAWGRIVNIAYQKGFQTEVNFLPVLTKRLSLAATTLRGRDTAQKQAIRDALRREVWPLLGGRIRPVTERIFPLAEAQQAHETMAKTGHIGKILLRMA
ncbi:MAG TPA: NAD(P)H-quinone oxidoreductase [Rhizomicrobium sp.]|nr:NAD(P)H-quinone oxidoreductase [Rhizomicrobium sp.]